MEQCKVLAKFDNFILCVENGINYFIKGISNQYIEMFGEKEKLISELKKWKKEIDFNNSYMISMENFFIKTLKSL